MEWYRKVNPVNRKINCSAFFLWKKRMPPVEHVHRSFKLTILL